MKAVNLFLSIVLFLSVSLSQVQAQQLKTFDPSKTNANRPKKSKQKLALEYYTAGEYEKAITLLEEINEEKPSGYIYKYLLYSYVHIEDYRAAEKLIKKTSKSQDKAYKELSDLGYIQLKKGKREKAQRMFEEAIEEVPPNIAAIKELGNDFRARAQTELAEKTYLHGKEIMGEEYGFENELGYLYYFMEKYELMTDAYLDLLERSSNSLKTVEYRFQNAFRRSSDKDIYPYLKTELLKRIKAQTENKQFSELLLWLSIQKHDFNIALIQAKSLDKQEGLESYRVFDLARVIQNQGDYKLAINTYKYLLKLPEAKYQIYYNEVVQNLCTVQYAQLQLYNPPTEDQIELVKQSFEHSIKELGINRFTIPLNMDYAEFKSFYLEQANEAVEDLEQLLLQKGLSNMDKAPVKLMLGDFYLLNNNPWDATLLFSQVEKDFTNDEIGFEAKMKNAKLSFYIGEFDWAKAQLDVLKSATGKKIANDALYLSLFIAENMDADSSTRALKLYGKAELLHLRKKDSLAIQTLDSIFTLSLYHEIFDDVWMKQSEIYQQAQQYDQARILLEKIADQYTYDLLADDAVFKLAQIEENHFLNYSKAEEWYKMILTEYPSSIYAKESRDRFRLLRGDDLEER